MDWNNIVITIGVVLATFGGIKIIADGIKAIGDLLPMAKLSERMEKLENRADESNEKYEHLQTIITAQSKLLIEMTNHMLTGNDVDKLKKKAEELTNAILEQK